MTGRGLVWDPERLTAAQRSGAACVVCRKRWPRPRFRVGTLGPATDAEAALFAAVDSASPVLACEDCVPLLDAPFETEPAAGAPADDETTPTGDSAPSRGLGPTYPTCPWRQIP